MANLTHVEARNVHGTNPQYLIEKVSLHKIWECRFWKEKLFGVNSETLLEVVVELLAVGGSYGGNRKPCDFLCCLGKLLQLQPEKEIIQELINQQDFKYVRVLGAAYLRMVGTVHDIYHFLEPLLLDWRKIRYRLPDGKYVISHVDEIVDDLLTKERVFDIQLPRIPTRLALEAQGKLAPRKNPLENLDNFDVEMPESDDEDKKDKKDAVKKEKSRKSRRSRSDSRGRRRRERRSDRRRRRSRSRDRRDRRSRSRERRRRRSRSGERDGGHRKTSMSIRETNTMRKSMGLKQL